jgi:hypothetical protein
MLGRATFADIAFSARWSIDAVWNIEKCRIQKFIETSVDEARAGCLEDVDAVKALAPLIWQRIARIFPCAEQIDMDVLAAAQAGDFERSAGSEGSVTVLRLILALVLGLLVSVFVAIWARGDASPVAIVGGLALALGAWLLGWVFYQLGLSFVADAGRPFFQIFVACGLAILCLAGVPTLLVVFLPEEPAIIVLSTTILSFVAAIGETTYEWRAWRYRKLLGKMFRSQVYFADAQHACCHRSNGEPWMTLFQTAVDNRAEPSRRISDAKEASA